MADFIHNKKTVKSVFQRRLIISNYDDLKNPYYAGGGALAIHEVSKRLISSFDVTVITGKFPYCKDEVIDGVSYQRIGVPFFGPLVGQIIFQLILPYYVLTCRFDIWMESFVPPFASLFLNFFSRKPVIALVHMLPAKDMERKYRLPFHLIQNLVIKFRHYFIVLTPQCEKEILSINPQAEVFVIPNGVNTHTKKSSRRPRHILFFGRLEYDQKGLDLLIEAYSLIASRQTLPLVIAGSGSRLDESRLRKKISKLKLESSIKQVGRVSGKHKERLFENALFIVLPSRFETFSIVALEALSYGKPLLCFDIPGLSWIPPQTSVKVPPFDIQQFARAMLELSTTSSLRTSLRKIGVTFARHFSWDSVTISYRNLLSTMLS